MSLKLAKNQIGAIGEHIVSAKLLENGWDAFIANQSLKNAKAYDIICVDPASNQPKMIQVKTSVENSFPVGMTLEEALYREKIEKKVVGPWVFVRLIENDNEFEHEFYILSREEMIELTFQSNDWYCNKFNRKGNIKLDSPCALTLGFLNGLDEPKNVKHQMFCNPLKGESSKGKWNKIFE